MAFVTRDINVLEGSTLTLPLCVYSRNTVNDFQALINWGDGSKELVKNFVKTQDTYYACTVDKKYTFPGTYTCSIEIRRPSRNPFVDSLKNVGIYNITVLPTTLTYAPSANFIIDNLSVNNRTINMFLDDSGVSHSFAGKTITSTVKDNSNVTIGTFDLTYSSLIPGTLTITAGTTLINAMTLNVNYVYAIIETANGNSGNILQGLIKKVSNAANGITVS